MEIILASQSPRRRELLEQIGITTFRVLPAIGEEITEPGLLPQRLVESLALQKGLEVQKHCTSEDIIIAADTVVSVGGQVLGKPKDEADAKRMLHQLSGQQHQVYTGLTVLRGDARRVAHERTEVFFRELTQAEIDWYVADGEPMDKAGAYGIQGKGGQFIWRIEGDYTNVVGLPVCRLVQLLKELGWEHD